MTGIDNKKAAFVRKKIWPLFLLMALLPTELRAMDCTIRDQWRTGTLLSPSAVIPQGKINFEPYFGGSVPLYAFDSKRNRSAAPPTSPRSISNSDTLSYGITDKLMLQIEPSFQYNFDQVYTSRGVDVADMPIILEYQFFDQQPQQCLPALTAITGLLLPTGRYDKLHNPDDAGGAGAFAANFGIMGELDVPLFDQNPLSITGWVTMSQPLDRISINGMSSYGTDSGFQGHGRIRPNGQLGLGLEYGLTKEWVMGLETIYAFAGSATISGVENTQLYTRNQIRSSDYFLVSPEIEYNFSSNLGVILGVPIMTSGRNRVGTVAPQIAFNMTF